MATHQTKMPERYKLDQLVYTRILGHFEMPKSHRWVESQDCWFCQNYSYSILLVSKSICENFFMKPKKNDREMY